MQGIVILAGCLILYWLSNQFRVKSSQSWMRNFRWPMVNVRPTINERAYNQLPYSYFSKIAKKFLKRLYLNFSVRQLHHTAWKGLWDVISKNDGYNYWWQKKYLNIPRLELATFRLPVLGKLLTPEEYGEGITTIVSFVNFTNLKRIVDQIIVKNKVAQVSEHRVTKKNLVKQFLWIQKTYRSS